LTSTTSSKSLTEQMGSSEGDIRADRAARNEALFRRVNERIEDVNAAFATIGEHGEFICECADSACTEKIQLALSEYEAVRSFPTRFVVKPGHVLPENERVVEEHNGYTVVEKIGHAGERARSLDERTQ
jgi:hypothetical protein